MENDMNCEESIVLLSDYDASALGENQANLIKLHLSDCVSCDGVYRELRVVIESARILLDEDGIAYPDEEIIWKRLGLAERAVH